MTIRSNKDEETTFAAVEDGGESDQDAKSEKKSDRPPSPAACNFTKTGTKVTALDADDGVSAMPTGIFLNAESMKAKLRQSMVQVPEYDVCNFYKKEGFCQMVARSSLFEKATLSVIAFNALWIAIDTDMNKAAVTLDAQPIFQLAEHGFCMYFTWEWVIRFCAFRWKRSGLRDAWFMFDSVMVIMMVGETWVMTIIMLIMGGGALGGGSTGSLRLLRLLRLSRMARMAKLLRSFPELLILIKGMASAMRSVIVTLVLLCLLVYVFAILFRQLLDGSQVGNKYFPTMWMAMHTLWLDGTLLDGPGSLVAMLLEEPSPLGVICMLLFYFFVLLAALTVMNMLIGVLCEVVSAVAATEREQITVSCVKEGFMDIINKGGLDADGDSKISRTEFETILTNPDAVRLLEKVDVDVYGFVDLADYLFEAEEGGEPVQMSFGDFMETVLSLRGTNTATVKDIVDLRKFIKSQFVAERDAQRRQSPPEGAEHLHNPELLVPSPAAAHTCGITSSSAAGASAAGALGLSHPAAPPGINPANPHWWMQVAEIEGILAAAQAKVERFVHAMPSGGLSIGLKRGVNDSLALPPSLEWNLGMLPGQIKDVSSKATTQQATPNEKSEDSLETISDEDLRPRAKAGLSPRQDSMPLPGRIAELRLQLQRLGQCLGASIEDLQGVQELL
mmetsp:Transcript_110686/g.308416  ORF Transcript_110686/g.308416 Transcript_110686/m.308416 type:complete len:674 (-) Transcript_110686:182-2203(-)|eukprot:CAMPEP_0179149226 /NCGR_PEP_ID=MMETSP0796-20121207/72277_1 /TAXON_ID=73915 /ORGANISM="Pyrodinium bahamense, Strain pbaha01" /LENGTH=673 /DNA_ID=CAMNT_0020850043 /DNA_START=58 /DNA_END=2079 /DNA_ORIENTATION=+